MKEQRVREPSEVFRENLQRLASVQRLDLDGLASSLGFIRDDKKWLRRAWNDRLARPDKRALRRLEKVAEQLGLKSVEEFWRLQAAENQNTVLRSMQNNDAVWQKLVGQIIEFVDAFRLFEAADPERAKEIGERYDSDWVKMVASWVRRSVETDEADRDETADEILEATAVVREYRNQRPFRERVRKLLNSCEEWAVMEEELNDELGAEACEPEIERRLTETFFRPLDDEEVAQRFYDRYLAQYSEEEQVENGEDWQLAAFLEGVSGHGEAMDSFVRECDGNEAAREVLTEMWQEIRDKSNGEISTEDAVEFAVKVALGEFDDSSEQDEQ